METEIEGSLQAFHRELAERFGEDYVTLAVFGSRAQGRARPESDLDLLVVVRGLPGRRFDRHRAIRELARSAGAEFADLASVIALTPEQADSIRPFYSSFLEGHRLIHDRGGYFRAVLDRLERRLKELGSRRLVDELGNPYWDLKPDSRLGENIIL